MNEEQTQRYELLLAKGKEAYENHAFGPALDAFDEAYDLQQTPELNQLITRVLLADGQFKTAQLFADEFIDSYLESAELAELYVTVALKNQQFIAAREFVTWVAPDVATPLTTEIETAEETFRTEQKATLNTIARQFYHLSDGDAINQKERLIAADKLPLREYLVGARFALVDPFLPAIARVTVLDKLRRLQVTESVDMTWLDEKVMTIVPKDLQSLDEMPLFQTVVATLSGYEHEFGPATVHALVEQARLMLMIAYPAIDRVVENPRAWAAGLMAEAMGENGPTEPVEQQSWRAKLGQEMMGLMP